MVLFSKGAREARPSATGSTNVKRISKASNNRARSNASDIENPFATRRRLSSGFSLGKRIYRVKTLMVELNDPPYNPGMMVTGQVITNYFRSERIFGLVLKVIGKGNVTWDEKVPYQQRLYHTQKKRTNSSEEIYVDISTELVDLEENEWTTIPAGRQEFPFEFALPEDIPSTFEEVGCVIQYVCCVVVKKIDKPKQKAEEPFIVEDNELDLNLYPQLRNPIQVSHQRNLSKLCCWKGGLVGFTFELEKAGFLPGELVRCHVEIFNSSSVRIFKSEVRFNKEITLFANDRERKYVVPIDSHTTPGIHPGSKEIYNGDWLTLPDKSAVGLNGCTIIRVRYYVKFVLIIPGGRNLGGIIPITIGSIPFKSLEDVDVLEIGTGMDDNFLYGE